MGHFSLNKQTKRIHFIKQTGQIWGCAVQIHVVSLKTAARKIQLHQPTLCFYKSLHFTKVAPSSALTCCCPAPHPAWKHSLVSRIVLQSHLFFPINPAHYVALPIPAVTMQYAILRLLMTHHDPSNINIMAGLVLIISVPSDGRAIGNAR